MPRAIAEASIPVGQGAKPALVRPSCAAAIATPLGRPPRRFGVLPRAQPLVCEVLVVVRMALPIAEPLVGEEKEQTDRPAQISGNSRAPWQGWRHPSCAFHGRLAVRGAFSFWPVRQPQRQMSRFHCLQAYLCLVGRRAPLDREPRQLRKTHLEARLLRRLHLSRQTSCAREPAPRLPLRPRVPRLRDAQAPARPSASIVRDGIAARPPDTTAPRRRGSRLSHGTARARTQPSRRSWFGKEPQAPPPDPCLSLLCGFFPGCVANQAWRTFYQ
jgi:hypothetical protein